MIGTTGTTKKMTKAQAQKLLASTSEEKMFWSHDEQNFRNLEDLLKGLNSMTNEVYMYHANTSKNDFSVWIREVIGDDQLAKDLEKASNRFGAALKVENRINYLKSVS